MCTVYTSINQVYTSIDGDSRLVDSPTKKMKRKKKKLCNRFPFLTTRCGVSAVVAVFRRLWPGVVLGTDYKLIARGTPGRRPVFSPNPRSLVPCARKTPNATPWIVLRCRSFVCFVLLCLLCCCCCCCC
jgi:hypothetical protein